MNTLKIIIIISFITYSCYAQDSSRFSLKTGHGYFCNIFYNITDKEFEENFSGNREFYRVHHGNSSFFEIMYKFKSGYWIGGKFARIITKAPLNDDFGFYWDITYEIPIDIYEIIFRYDFNFNKHSLYISGGPLFRKAFEPDIWLERNFNMETQQWEIVKINFKPRELRDIGLSLNIDYVYNIYKYLNIGVKGEVYYLVFLGFEGITVSPVIEVKF